MKNHSNRSTVIKRNKKILDIKHDENIYYLNKEKQNHDFIFLHTRTYKNYLLQIPLSLSLH